MLLRGCEAGVFGEAHREGNSTLYNSLCTYLDSEVDEKLLERYAPLGGHLVCLSEPWAEALARMGLKTYLRRQMQPQKTRRTEGAV